MTIDDKCTYHHGFFGLRTPEKLTCPPEHQWLEDVISNWNGPFLGDMLIGFGRIYSLLWLQDQHLSWQLKCMIPQVTSMIPYGLWLVAKKMIKNKCLMAVLVHLLIDSHLIMVYDTHTHLLHVYIFIIHKWQLMRISAIYITSPWSFV